MTGCQTSVPSTSFVPPKPKPGASDLPDQKPAATVANFYGPSVKPPSQPLDKKASKPLDSGSAVSVKRPAVCVRGKCVSHSEERFRVEVGYNAELITVFKNISSRNYGKLWSLLSENLFIYLTLFLLNVKTENIWHIHKISFLLIMITGYELFTQFVSFSCVLLFQILWQRCGTSASRIINNLVGFYCTLHKRHYTLWYLYANCINCTQHPSLQWVYASRQSVWFIQYGTVWKFMLQ